jgi:hypothetical protein
MQYNSTLGALSAIGSRVAEYCCSPIGHLMSAKNCGQLFKNILKMKEVNKIIIKN